MLNILNFNQILKLPLKNLTYNIFSISFVDSDQTDTAPPQELLHLYWYKLCQLRELMEKVYNSDDLKRLQIKLATAKRAPLAVNIFYNFNYLLIAKNYSTEMRE